ncbi:MAG: alkene reductase [Caulobacterales bacterium 32-69-10]|nr:MAG: alkene reductase [Caulobacterales bacterium 32-69-10]
MSLLFSKAKLGSLELQNHLVMSPMTRSRAIGNVPNDLMVEYYGQRAGAGLILTEGVAPSPNALGYARIPGIFSTEQVAGWKKITDAVHAKGAKIFCQFMHTGRVGHPANLPAGAKVVGPSAIAAAGDMWTDADGMQPMPTPEVIDVKATIAEHVQAAKNAIAAGFDGVELHGANGYLIEQFIRPNSNQRTDSYGGGIENRARFMLEVVEAVSAAIGKDKVGIRLSPYGVFNDMPIYPEMDADYLYLAEKLSETGLLYIHLVDHSSMGAPEVPASLTAAMRKAFKGPIILSGGYFTAERAEADLAAGKGELVAFGRAFLANPDLVERLKTGAPLNEADMASFYTPGPEGYTDYPTLSK